MRATAALDEHVLAITTEIFTAIVDGFDSGIRRSPLGVADIVDPTSAWVDIGGEVGTRVVLTTGTGTAAVLARAMLDCVDDGDGEGERHDGGRDGEGDGGEDGDGGDGGDNVVAEDLADAVGEIVNGGKLKALNPDARSLSLPQVTGPPPMTTGTLQNEVGMAWQGRPIVITLWELTADRKGVTA